MHDSMNVKFALDSNDREINTLFKEMLCFPDDTDHSSG
jgi:hypothetical protein